ncbi:MaoC family dehydratase [Actinophytocola oryzae]|uniref:Acyl dehydratase n=1 Tax=Actinophytocola oryzae TaxID=502181 RepID=A0A4R7VYX2_9PSEU|nr:MaoC family dehydratase [Actinophytocola oryzae]TDV55390.1 acyl dehydratase [Actinophytocola oryzae]
MKVRGIAELGGLAGTTLGPTEWHEVTQEQVNLFAAATGDHQWIHTDPSRAAEGPFGGTIAHGYLTLALIIPLWTEMLVIEDIGMGVNYGLNKLRFPTPVPVDGRIRLTAHIAEATRLDENSVQLTVDFTMGLEGSEKPAVAAQALYRYLA